MWKYIVVEVEGKLCYNCRWYRVWNSSSPIVFSYCGYGAGLIFDREGEVLVKEITPAAPACEYWEKSNVAIH